MYFGYHNMGVRRKLLMHEKVPNMAESMDRLESLAVMKIHRDIAIDYQKAAKMFLESHPRKMNENSLIYV